MPAARGDGWQLTPVLSLDAIRLFVSLGGRLERDLRSAVLPAAAASELIERFNVNTLHAGPKECLDSAGQLAQELTRELGIPVGPGVPKDKRDRWGRLLVTRRSHRGRDGTTTAELELRVVTFPAREYSQRRLGSVRRDDRYGQPSAVMDLGEAVQTAVERGLPLLLSTEAAGHLADTVRVGRMKGTARRAHDHQLGRPVRDHPAGGRRAGDQRAAHAQAGRREGHARRRRPAARAHDAWLARSPMTRCCSAASNTWRR